MHRCLEIPEILEAIVAFSAESKPPDAEDWDWAMFKEDTSANVTPIRLPPFSLTCRYFHAAAVRFQWKTLPRLTHISRFFPDGIAVGGRKPKKAHWDRALLYTKHVTTLGCADGDIDILRFLGAHKSQYSLFPSLKQLSLNIVRKMNTFIERVPVLLGPKIECIKITARRRPEVPRLVRTIAQHVPKLQKLSLHCLGAPDTTTKDFNPADVKVHPFRSQSPFPFLSLTELDCRGVYMSMDTLVKLSSLRTLEVLSFRLPLNEERALMAKPLPARSFPALREWRTEGLYIAQPVVDILQSCTLPHLKDFTLELIAQPSKMELHTLFTALGRHPDLEVVYLTRPLAQPGEPIPHYYFFENQADALVFPAVLAPLAPCRNLRVLSLRHCTSGFHDDEVAYIAETWPHLRILQIGTNCNPDYTDVTWTTLVCLAVQLPELVCLGMNARNARHRIEAAANDLVLQCPSVQFVDFDYEGCFFPEDVELLAKVISRPFPNAVARLTKQTLLSLPVYRNYFAPELDKALSMAKMNRAKERLRTA